MGLLGPNGSGKTTILRILAGYLRPSAGTARIAGLDVVDDSLAARRCVGYVPEDVPLYGGMAVREFLVFMGRLKGLTAPGLSGAVSEAMHRLRLEQMHDVQIGRLSRGYRQRVAIAQALLGNPALLILDEPTNGLDPRQIIEMRELIRSLGFWSPRTSSARSSGWPTASRSSSTDVCSASTRCVAPAWRSACAFEFEAMTSTCGPVLHACRA